MAGEQLSARLALSDEWHARPGVSLALPFRCTHVVELRTTGGPADSRDDLVRICNEFGRSAPPEGARHHIFELGSCLVKWENHTEAVSHTVFVPGNGQPPFSETAFDFLPERQRQELAGRMFVGVQVEVLRPPGADDPHGYQLARSLLGGGSIYGGWMSARTAVVWSSFRLDARGFVRLVIIALQENEERVCRLLHRLLDIETYRMLAMMALPKARDAMAMLGDLEPELDEVMGGLVEGQRDVQEQSLQRITSLAARVEHIGSTFAYRLAAAQAYMSIVERRCSEVDEEVLGDHQRYTNFLSRSLAPAMRTCEAAERRLHDLAERVGRAANLLDTMVDVVKKRQNQAIMESLADSARLQLKLQQAVEGFSIVAISYYAVGLLGYVLKAAKAAGLAVRPDLMAGLAAPLVLATVWLAVRRVRRGLEHRAGREEHSADA